MRLDRRRREREQQLLFLESRILRSPFRRPRQPKGSRESLAKIYPIPGDAVDCSVVAHLEQTTLTILAVLVVTSMPWSAHSLPDLPLLLRVGYGRDLANDFVARSDGE